MNIKDFKFNENDIITTDGYLNFCNNNEICYIKTDFFYIGTFNWRGELHPKKISDICVVGHSDYPITTELSNNFTKLFCINRCTDSKNIFGIPLGITNDCDDSSIHKIYGNRQIMIETQDKTILKDNLSYINFNIQNFPTERNIIYNILKNEKWVKFGKIDNTIEGRKKYLEEIKSSKFVFCPRGNGIDTHRLWETLYMGSIPIVRYENAHHLFTDLPILFIDDWNIINENFLEEKYNEIVNKDWNMDKLTQSYWNNFILNNINNNE
jgi:hypothetical protein